MYFQREYGLVRIDIATNKEELAHMKKAAKQQQLTQKDSRNLYLL